MYALPHQAKATQCTQASSCLIDVVRVLTKSANLKLKSLGASTATPPSLKKCHSNILHGAK